MTIQNIKYHVTPKKNVQKILRQWLVPKVGDRSKELWEPTPRIYLFNTQDEAWDGLANWLWDCFDDDVVFALLEVDISWFECTHEAFETQICVPIPPDKIKVICDNW